MCLKEELGGWLVEAVESDDPRRSLLAQRRKLAQVMELSMGRDAATLAKGIQQIDQLLAKLGPDAEVTELDELRARRDRHWSTAAGKDPARGSNARRDRRSGGKAVRSSSG